MTGPQGVNNRVWQIGPDRVLTLDRPRVLAILNLTPDSFSDGGNLKNLSDAIAAAERAAAEGADALDLGGESTRPGATRIDATEQIRRVIPVLRAIRRAGGALASIPISIDTTLAAVAEAALAEGADAINDVAAGVEDPVILPLAARARAGLILMHRREAPGQDSYSDQYRQPPHYSDVVAEVLAFLAARVRAAIAAGVAPERIVLDPGLGFGKTVAQNLELVRRTPELGALGYPILSAASRKSFVGRASGLESSAPAERLAGSIAFSVAHYLGGARVFRVHDVGPQVQCLRAAAALAGP